MAPPVTEELESVPPKPTVCIAMIVKNEAAIIERCLDSALPLADRWLIIDTGSTDDTCALIERKLSDLPGELLRSKWRDFGTNRSELMREARNAADWLLLLDADFVVEHDPGWDQELQRTDVDSFLVDVTEDEVGHYLMPSLVRGRRPWYFEGVTHESITSDTPGRREFIASLRIRHLADGNSRADRLVRDRTLLMQDLLANPDNPRSVFDLAQTLRDLGETTRAIGLYRRRVRMGGPVEEEFYAQYQIGILLMEQSWPQAVPALLKAYSLSPNRAEPLYHLARGYRRRAMYPLAHLFAQAGMAIAAPDDGLFVESYVYDWGLRFERSVAAWYVDRRGECYADSIILRDRPVPEPWLASVKSNLALFETG